MKKIAIILMILVLLTGCYGGKTDTESAPKTTVTVTAPVDDTVNGYKTAVADDNLGNTYIANKSSKKFHTSSCTYAKKIGENNKRTSDSRQQLINEGYSPCKNCNP